MAKKVLVLGAGMVSGPCVDYLLRNHYDVTVVSAVQTDLERTSFLCPSAKVFLLNIAQETSKLKDIVSQHDVVISILPAYLHPQVIQCCISCKKSLIHASYEDDIIRAAHDSAKAAGITILSEVGLDPGIDHLLAMDCIDSIHEQGGQVTSYVSLCGGLPAPECSNGPLRYKFSWYPKGMFISAMKKAKFIRDQKVVEVPEGHIFDRPNIVDGLLQDCQLEDIPNRNSTEYMKMYNIQSANTIYRGTLRYKGFSIGMQALISLGLTNSDVVSQLLPDSSNITWRELVCILGGIPQNSSQITVRNWMQTNLELSETQLKIITDLGILGNEEVPKLNTPLDALCAHLAKELAYGSQDRDMVVMRNIINSTLPNGKQQQHTFDLVKMGDVNGFSAMAQTVGLTVAICAGLVVEGAVTKKGAINQ
uniref:Saccharopine dehydrogenase NADP binding domain-containing protein n=1 Tax=Arion vulgaris TaxID=1028688 RepID=A0A0B7A6E1_9EUPU